MAEGEIPCPPNSDYTERTIRYATVEDTRGCTNCECGDLGSTCLTEYEYFTTTDCSGSPAGTVMNGACTAGVTMAAINFDTSTLSCPVASESEPEGEIQVKDPWTYCCAPF